MTRTPDPWEDAPTHTCGQPIIPEHAWQGGTRPDSECEAIEMHCLGCGEVWAETDPAVIARAWWSQGAWHVHDSEEAG